MNFVLDPVWPWSRLWEHLAQVPPAIRGTALIAALTAFALVPVAFARMRGLLLALAGVLVLALGFVVRHLWPAAMADANAYSGAGVGGFLLGLLWLVGLVLLLLLPFALAGLSAAAYVGQGVPRKKLATVVTLRLLAFALALIALARPALAFVESEEMKSLLFIAVDRSRSMTIQDERGKQSRWDRQLRALDDCDAALTRLRDEHQIEVRFFSFADDLTEFDPTDPGKPDGKRTDFGLALRKLFDRRDAQLPLRGLLVCSDGGDNGLAVPALAEASRWRGVPCLIHTFAVGSPRANLKQNDVAITSISTSPSPFVPVKGKLTVKVNIDARGFENTKATVRLYLEGEDGKDVEAVKQEVRLPLTTGNEVTLSTDAPAKPGEVKVKVVVETPDPDDFPLNNSIETFVTVSKEGISVLLVDRQRDGEPQAICDALTDDPRIRVTPIWIRGGKPIAGADSARLFGQEDTPYDVVILGDVTLDMLKSADEKAVERIAKLAGRGSGLMVLGGLTNLGNGGWAGTELERILPVDLSEKEQIEGEVKMVPTQQGRTQASYILRLDEGDLGAAWEKVNKTPLEGATRLKLHQPLRGTEVVLARMNDGDKGDPLLVMGQYSAGDKGKPGAGAARVLVFGGDTTHRWKQDEASKERFGRFWKQIVVWLAKQEDAEGMVWVRPDVRRLPVRSDLGFQVGMRGKGGGPDIRDGKYEVEVITPTGQTIRTPITRGATENRGTFTATQTPGVYKIHVRGEGTDPSGGKVTGESTARVIVYDEDLEMTRPAADPEFLSKLSSASGGGEALRIDQLADFLNRLAEKPLERNRGKQTFRPDWQTRSRSGFLAMYFVAFCVIVSAEWGLRRWWGMK